MPKISIFEIISKFIGFYLVVIKVFVSLRVENSKTVRAVERINIEMAEMSD